MSENKEYIFDYISEILLDFFQAAYVSSGERYHIRYEQQKQVSEQFEALLNIASILNLNIEPFTFHDYTSYCIRFAEYKLIIAASVADISVDFLTGLRNRVIETGNPTFDDAAILFIHHTSLDSIIGGCKSLADYAMPLNVHYIREKIKQRVSIDDNFLPHEKHVLSYRIDQIGEDSGDSYSLFNYSIFLQILGKKTISLEDYFKLGLFPDKGLKGLNREDTIKRLIKNEEWFDEVSNGHQYGGLEKVLERSFSQKGVEKLSVPEVWMLEDMTNLVGWNDEKNKTSNIVYIPNVSELTDDFCVCWDKADGDSMLKKRTRHILVFNHESRLKLNLTLNFDNRPRKDGFGQIQNLSEFEYSISGKKILLNLVLDNPDQMVCKALSYSHPGFSSKYVFNILVVPFRSNLLSGIKADFAIKGKVKDWYLTIKLVQQITFNEGQPSTLSDLIRNDAIFNLREDQTLVLNLDKAISESDTDESIFYLSYYDKLIPVHVTGDTAKTEFISAHEVREKKMTNGSFTYHSSSDNGKTSVTLTQGTERYYTKDEFRENLFFEQIIIDDGHLASFQNWDYTLSCNTNIAIDTHVEAAYKDLIRYFKESNLLPSLAELTETLEILYNNFLKIFIKQLKSLEPGKALSKSEADLLKLGTVEMQSGNRMLKLTPLHPLNIAYLLEVKNALLGKSLASYLLERLRPLNLIPYIKGHRKPSSDGHYYYQPIEQNSSTEWLYYFCDEISSQQVSKHFVPELVHKKIDQFLKHFGYLFLSSQTVLRINLFNQGDAKEILQGIFSYFAKFFRKDRLNPEDAIPIQVTVYGSNNCMTKFEELTLCDDVSLIGKSFDFKLPIVAEPDELFDLYNRKVTFFITDETDQYEYAHLSFYQFSPEEVIKSANNMLEVPSGISLNGLMADVPSVFQRNSFRTGFGIGGINPEQNDLLSLTVAMNAYVSVTNTHDQFKADEAIGFVINKSANKAIEQVYARSQWVTFIEPKVDLTFFKSYKDVVIIHYSDQYNNASGYDAITITSKWEPYKATIQEVFKQQGIETSEQSVIHILDLFNSINGEWLLDMNSPSKNSSYFRMEKLSMLSAVKAALAILDHDDITWVPISLEEILRVSGAVGLKRSDGLFSAKNLGSEGAHTDDLLLVGLEEKDETLELHLYPIEVKIGNVESGTFAKAREQSAKTASLLRKFLMDDEQISGKIYRNFFAKLILISAEKFALYDIWPAYNEKWRAVAALKSKLLNDDFKVSSALDASIGYYGVMAFKWTQTFIARSIDYEDDGCTITLLKGDALRCLTTDVSDLRDLFLTGQLDAINSQALLANRYPLYEDSIPSIMAEKLIDEGETSVYKIESSDINECQNTALVFNMLSPSDILKNFNAVYEKLTAIGIAIKKELPAEISFFEGPAFYRIEIKPAPGTMIKKIKAATEELNIALQLPEEASVRIFSDLGKIWLEAPKQDSHKITVSTDHIWPLFKKNSDFQVPFGVDIEGNVQSVNFSSSNSPHLLLAGTTGSGKSVVLDTLIRSAANFYSPKELQFFLVDPKGNELIDFEELEHTPKPNGMSSEEAIELLEEAVNEMDRRYLLFRDIREISGRAAKDINDYNEFVKVQESLILARWLIVLDEYSDLLDENPANKGAIELLLKRLAQKARAAGIHVIVATQKPLVNIISSAIKSNLPGVIALRVRTAIDSRVILDDSGAETLAGRGDALFKNGTGQMVRVQCAIFNHP